jgi:hypothetical protein
MANVTTGNIQHLLGAGTAGTSPSITINAGSGIYVSTSSFVGSAPTVTLTDSQGNNYAAAGVHIAQIFNSNAGAYLDQWYIPPTSVTSGALTVSFASTVSLFDALMTIAEVLNANTTALITQSNHTNGGFTAGPISSNTLTVTPPSGGTLLLSGFFSDLGATATITETQGFSILYSNPNTGGAAPPVGALGGRTETTNGTYNASWNDGGSADRTAWIVAIPGSSTSPSTAPIAWVR